jgi:hypothetical protein
VVKQSEFNSRVSKFTAGEETIEERSSRASAKESVHKAQMPAPVAKLLNGGGEQVLRGG